MLEILGLVVLLKHIRKMTETKGVSPKKYVTITVIAWFGLEILAFVIGVSVLGIDSDPLSILPLAILGAAMGGGIGYFVTKNAMERLPEIDSSAINPS